MPMSGRMVLLCKSECLRIGYSDLAAGQIGIYDAGFLLPYGVGEEPSDCRRPAGDSQSGECILQVLAYGGGG